MAITIEGTLETLLRKKIAAWREADGRYHQLIRQTGADLGAIAAAIRDADAAARPLAMLLSAVVE